MGKYRYITNRLLEGGGRIRVLVPTGSDEAEVSYTCPKCGFSEETRKPWKKPFSIRCSKCGFLIRVPSLRKEIKKK
ncbi:MAG: hypothetical protein DRP12_00855 [Candidatus Aenigmatarchaeota archaeon]|nr:MAG: hypothetical protein DRP12_00855 [Candidatus Aenigmarchaeota archaeon]